MVEMNENAKAVLEALAAAENPMTLAEISEVVGFTVQPGTVTGLINKGFVAKGDTVIVETAITKPAATYVFVTDEAGVNDKGQTYEYSDKELAIIAAVKASDKPMTLADISTAVGFDVKPGNVTSLVTRKGNLAKGEDAEVPGVKKSKVGTYFIV